MRASLCGSLVAVGYLTVCLCVTPARAETDTPAITFEEIDDTVTVNRDYSYVLTMRQVKKATNTAGAAKLGQLTVNYVPSLQDLDVVEAYTLKPDGTKLAVDTKTIYEQQAMAANGIAISDMHSKVILFPHFSAGDTAVYSLRMRIKLPLYADAFYYGNVFDPTQTYKRVRNTITVPKDMKLRVESHDVAYTTRTQGDTVMHTWTYASAGRKSDDTIVVSPREHMPRYFVSTFKDYTAIGRTYATTSAPKTIVTPQIQTLADQIAAGLTDRREIARALYEWVCAHIRYVGVELNVGRIVPQETATILSNGYGDCKDHDVLLQALLKAKGIASTSILVDAYNSYTLTEVPTPYDFDHVITYVPEFDTYLDSSPGLLPFGTLAWSTYGKPAVRASLDAPQRITIPIVPAGLATTTTTSVQTLAKDGTLSGTTTTTVTGPNTLDMRQFVISAQMVGSAKMAENILSTHGYREGTGTLTMDPPLSQAPHHSVSATFTAKGWGDVASGKETTYIPGGLRIATKTGDGAMGSFGSEEKDVAAIPCYSVHEHEDISLRAPQGMTFKPLPDDTQVRTKYIQYTSHWTKTDDTVTVHRDFISTVDRPVCEGQMRRDINAALKKIVDSYDDQIGLIAPDEATEAQKTAGSGNADDRLNSGNSLLQQKADDKTVAEYSAILTATPDNREIRIKRAGAYIQQNKFAAARDDLDILLRNSPDDAVALGARGYANMKLRQYESANADLTRAIALNPKDAWAHYNRALLFIPFQQNAEALADLDTAVKLDPNVAQYHMDRAQLLMNMRQNARALEAIRKAIALEPKNTQYLIFSAMLRLNSRDYAGAVEDCNKILALKPNTASAYHLRGMARNSMGNTVSGNKDIAKALKLNPKLADPNTFP